MPEQTPMPRDDETCSNKIHYFKAYLTLTFLPSLLFTRRRYDLHHYYDYSYNTSSVRFAHSDDHQNIEGGLSSSGLSESARR